MNNERENQKKDAIIGFVISIAIIIAWCAIVYFNSPVEHPAVVETEATFPIEEVSDEIVEFETEVEEVVAEVEEAEEEEEVVEEEVVVETAAAPVTYQASYSGYVENGDGLTMSGGVNYHNGRRETWYSSNAAYHYRTGEWTVGEDGVYRDADGYIVVAASDLAQGSTVETSLGTGKVYDSGCAAGTTDIYTAW